MPRTLWNLRPKWVSSGPVLQHETTLEPVAANRVLARRTAGRSSRCRRSTPKTPTRPGWRHSNLGMYRVQLAGNEYQPDRQAGLHYQIHRGIGVHHAAALRKGVPFRVNIFVGGPPAMTLAAVMPLPEGLPELAFAGALGGRRVRLIDSQPCGPARLDPPLPLAADADFCITRHGRSATCNCPRGRSAIISAITASSILSRC